MASRIKRSAPVTINDVLDGHVGLDPECLDRLYLHGYLAQLQVGGQVIQFLQHRGYPVPSPACLQQIGDAFRRRVTSFADANRIPLVALKATDRNIDVMKPYLDRAAAAGRSQVAAIGVAQEMQRVFISRQRPTDPGKCPQFSFDKKDRREDRLRGLLSWSCCTAVPPGLRALLARNRRFRLPGVRGYLVSCAFTSRIGQRVTRGQVLLKRLPGNRWRLTPGE
jgi:hypothetical protein